MTSSQGTQAAFLWPIHVSADAAIAFVSLSKHGLHPVGGKAEKGESPLETVSRETYEEIGTIFSDIGLFGSVLKSYCLEHADEEHCSCLDRELWTESFFFTKITSSEANCLNRNDELTYVTLPSGLVKVAQGRRISFRPFIRERCSTVFQTGISLLKMALATQTSLFTYLAPYEDIRPWWSESINRG